MNSPSDIPLDARYLPPLFGPASNLFGTHRYADEDEAKADGDKIPWILRRLEDSAKRDPDEAIRNAAGDALAKLLGHFVTHGVEATALSSTMRSLKKNNAGFKERWKKEGRQGKRKQLPHHKTLRRFVLDWGEELMPREICHQVAQDLLGDVREYTAEQREKHPILYFDLPEATRTTFAEWVKPRLTGLDEKRAEFAKVKAEQDEYKSQGWPGYPWDATHKLVSKLARGLKKLCALHFDELWTELFVPRLKLLFESDETNPLLNDDALKKSDEWKHGLKSVAWSKHEGTMKNMLRDTSRFDV